MMHPELLWWAGGILATVGFLIWDPFYMLIEVSPQRFADVAFKVLCVAVVLIAGALGGIPAMVGSIAGFTIGRLVSRWRERRKKARS